MRQAIHGSYNLKDPPRSPTLKYPGPQWIPDNLCTAWCVAETLTRCLPQGTLITYESTRRMLDYVLPHQREHCEDGIELMLIAGHFTPERAPYTRSSVSSSPLKPESMGLRKSHRRDSPQAPHLQDNCLEETRSTLGRAHMAHPVARLSSLMPDCPSVQPSRLMKSLP